MGDGVMVADYSDQKQRAAVCYSAWERRDSEKASVMRLYGAIEKVEPLDDGTVRVHGIATTEARDDQREIVRASAISAALPDYMKFPAVREMHQLSAAGTTLEADVGPDKITRIVAHVVDPVAVSKVKNRVYRGFSIGGRVTSREPGDPTIITGLQLNEISLVDRPANPESVFDCWKASEITMGEVPFNPPFQIWACGVEDHRHLAKSDAMRCQEAQKAAQTLNAPSTITVTVPKDAVAVQIDDFVVPVKDAVMTTDEAHAEQAIIPTEKADKPAGAFADPGYQDDKKPRYKLNTESQIRAAWSYIHMPKNRKFYTATQLSSIEGKITSAWKSKIDKDGPPSASDKAALGDSLRKALWNIPQLIYLCDGLQQYCESLFVERAVEGDDSEQPEKLKAIVSDLLGFLRDQVAEDTAEALEGTDADEDDMLAECWAPHAAAMMKILQNISGSEKLVSEIEKRNLRHNRADQALLDTTAYAVHKAMGAGTAKRADLVLMADARKSVLDAGASDLNASPEMLTNSNPTGGAPTQNSTVDSGRGGNTPVPQPGIGGGSNVTMVKTAVGFAAIDAIEKAGGGHVALMNAAHDLLCSVSDGVSCQDGTSRHSAADTAMMVKAHDSMVGVAGVKCAANETPKPEGEAERQGTVDSTKKAAEEEAAVKTIEDAVKAAKVVVQAENDTLAKTIEGIVAKYAPASVDPMVKSFNDAIAALSEKFETFSVGMTAKVEGIGADVTKIKETPLPPLAVARMPPRQIAGPTLNPEMTNDQIAIALSKMSKEEQTLALIKASPQMQLKGITDGPSPGDPRAK